MQRGNRLQCPECGRTLWTRLNKFQVEMWPLHKCAAIGQLHGAELAALYRENQLRQPGQMDWEVTCINSGTPVVE